MDGFPHAIGILYAENFEDPPPAPPPEPEPDPIPEPQSPALTRDDVDHACRLAVLEARDTWSRSAQTHRTEALATIAATIGTLAETLSEQAEATAEAIARTALAALAAALPHLCATHGDSEVRALVQRLLPLLATRTPLVIRVHPGLIEPLRADIHAIDPAIAAHVEFRPTNLPQGDVRLAWQDGALNRDTVTIRAAIEQALAQLGLLPQPTHHPAEPRIPALAR